MASWPDDEHDTIEAPSAAEFRAWMEANHDTVDAVWLMYWKKGSGRPSIDWPEAVDVALCYGWIDTKVTSVDADRYVQYFTHRRPGSPWSRLNKDKVDRLVADGLMTGAGLAAIERAKADGSWSMMDDADALVVADDLAEAFEAAPGSRGFFDGMTRSAKVATLAWIYTAKRAATRSKRIDATIAATSRGEPPRPS